MAFIPDLSEIPDLVPVPEGEYDLRIIKTKETSSKRTGRNGVLLIMEILDEDNAENLLHTLWFGNDGKYQKDDEEKSMLMWRMVKDFLKSIGLSPDGDIEPEDFIDLEFTALVTYNDGIDDDGKQEYQPKNEIGRIL